MLRVAEALLTDLTDTASSPETQTHENWRKTADGEHRALTNPSEPPREYPRIPEVDQIYEIETRDLSGQNIIEISLSLSLFSLWIKKQGQYIFNVFVFKMLWVPWFININMMMFSLIITIVSDLILI